MTTPTSAPPRAARGWPRGLLVSGLVLALAWVFHQRETARPAAPAPGVAPLAPAAAVVPLPADTTLAPPREALPRLLVFLPVPVTPAQAALEARLRQVSAGRLVVRREPPDTALALGLSSLPACILYDGAGHETRRWQGFAPPRLAAELAAYGVTDTDLAAEVSP